MTYSCRSLSLEEFSLIRQDLELFGTNFHERIEIKQDQNGFYYPATAPKPRSIRWFIELFYKPKNRRSEVVAAFLYDFFLQHQTRFAASVEPVFLGKFDRLLTNLNDKWVSLRKGLSERIEVFTSNILPRTSNTTEEKKQEPQREEKAIQTDSLELGVSDLTSALSSLPHQQDDFDVSLVCQDGIEVHAHSFILKRHSPSYFTTFFTPTWKANPKITATQNTPSSTVRLLLDLLYGNKPHYPEGRLHDYLRLFDLIELLNLPESLINKVKLVCTRLFADTPELIVDAFHFFETIGFRNYRLQTFLLFELSRLKLGSTVSPKKVQSLLKMLQTAPQNPFVLTALGKCNFSRIGMDEPDLSRGFTYYQDAARTQYIPAICESGRCWLMGWGTPNRAKNLELGMSLLEEAMKQNYPTSYYYLGNYLLGLHQPELLEKGTRLVEQAALLNDPCAQFVLGIRLLENGLTPERRSKGMKLIKQSASQRYPSAMSKLGDCYMTGEGVVMDYAKGVNLQQQASRLGEPIACFNLGTTYENGISAGVHRIHKDPAKALHYYTLGGLLGHEGCQKKLAELRS